MRVFKARVRLDSVEFGDGAVTQRGVNFRQRAILPRTLAASKDQHVGVPAEPNFAKFSDAAFTKDEAFVSGCRNQNFAWSCLSESLFVFVMHAERCLSFHGWLLHLLKNRARCLQHHRARCCRDAAWPGDLRPAMFLYNHSADSAGGQILLIDPSARQRQRSVQVARGSNRVPCRIVARIKSDKSGNLGCELNDQAFFPGVIAVGVSVQRRR